MKYRKAVVGGIVSAVAVGGVWAGMSVSEAATTPTSAAATPKAAALAVRGGAPYIYTSVSGTKDPVNVMKATGVKAFTLAFILNKGTCSPVWDSGTLNDSSKQSLINKIRGAGGDVVVSFGGFSGNKLANSCSNETALAGAYQKVIDLYKLKAIDIDLEAGEVSQSNKVLKALKIVKQKNAGISTILTLGTGKNGLEGDEAAIPGQAAAIGSPVDNWTIMPFDFSDDDSGVDHGAVTVSASEGLHKQLKSALGGTDASIYAKQGISSMNAKTDSNGNVTVANFNTMLAYAQQHGLTRFTYWELSRDNTNLDYTKVIGKFLA
jgi:chitinase